MATPWNWPQPLPPSRLGPSKKRSPSRKSPSRKSPSRKSPTKKPTKSVTFSSTKKIRRVPKREASRGYSVTSLSPEERLCVDYVLTKHQVYDREDLDAQSSNLTPAQRSILEVCLTVVENKKATKEQKAAISKFLLK